MLFLRYSFCSAAQVHDKLRPFGCPDCDKKFGEKSNATKHYKSVHERQKNATCEQCGAVFAFRDGLSRHVRLSKSMQLRSEKCTVFASKLSGSFAVLSSWGCTSRRTEASSTVASHSNTSPSCPPPSSGQTCSHERSKLSVRCPWLYTASFQTTCSSSQA